MKKITIFFYFYWGLDCLYPQKKIVEFSLKKVPDNKVLIKDKDDATEYEILLTSVNLDVNYVHLEVSYLSNLNNLSYLSYLSKRK